MPSGKRGRFPVGTPVLDAARQLGVYVESVCGGRATCGRCQIEVQEGNFAKHKIVSSHDHISPKGAKEERYERVRGLPERPPPLLLGARSRATSSSTCRRTRSSTRRSSARPPTDRVIERNAAVQLCYVEVDEPDMHKPLGDLDRLKADAGEGLGLEGPAGRAAPDPAGAENPAQGQLGRHRRRPPRHGIVAALHHRALSRPEERGLRHRLRHRLDHHRHASGLAAVGPHRRLVRHVEPADPLRRGSDEPRLLRDDEPGRPRGDDQGRARGGQRADRQGLRGRRRRPPRHLRLRLRRQPDHAPPVPRHRPDRTRPGAVRARRLRRAAVLGARDRHRGQPRRARSTCCPASPAMSARTPPARRCRKARTGRTR